MSVTIEEVLKLLDKLDPRSEEFKSALELLRGLYWYRLYALHSNRVEEKETRGSVVNEPIADNVIVHTEPKQETAEVAEGSDELIPQVVRDELTSLAQLGIKVKPVMAKYIPEGQVNKFSNIPVAKYGELMAEVKQLKAEAKQNAG